MKIIKNLSSEGILSIIVIYKVAFTLDKKNHDFMYLRQCLSYVNSNVTVSNLLLTIINLILI